MSKTIERAKAAAARAEALGTTEMPEILAMALVIALTRDGRVELATAANGLVERMLYGSETKPD